jgi:hypothetical protein
MRVVNFAYIIISILIACSTKEHATITNYQGQVEITFAKTKDGSSVVAGQCYDFESKKQLLPASIRINGVVLKTDNGFFQYSVLTGSYKIEAGFVGKKWVTSKLKLQKGDSVFIKFYLKDDDSPLYENR